MLEYMPGVFFTACLVGLVESSFLPAQTRRFMESAVGGDHVIRGRFKHSETVDSLPSLDSEKHPMSADDGYCLDVLLVGLLGVRPRVLLWQSDLDVFEADEIKLDECGRKRLPVFVRVNAVFAKQQLELHAALASLGVERPVGTRIPPDALAMKLKSELLDTEVHLGICLPERCDGPSAAEAAVLMLIMPWLSQETLLTLMRDFWRVSGLPFAAFCTFEHADYPGDSHLFTESERESERHRLPSDVAHALLSWNRLASSVRAHTSMVYSESMSSQVSRNMSWLDQERAFGGPFTSAALLAAWTSALDEPDSPIEPTKEMLEIVDGKYKTLLRIAAEMGIPQHVSAAISSAFDVGWPIQRNSSSTRAFPDISVYHMTDICVRDLSYETDYKFLESSIPTGHRLELLTVGLREDEVAELERRPPAGRFVVTHLKSLVELASRLKGVHVTAWRGQSQFLYDGHSASTRCPDCSNIEHHLMDDLILDLLAWRTNRIRADRIVSNLQASVGSSAQKRWFEQLIDALAGEIPHIEMRLRDVFCFESVTLTFNSWAGEGMSAIWRKDALYSGTPLAHVLAWARDRVWEAAKVSVAAGVCQSLDGHEVLAVYARQDQVGSQKSRQWLDFERVAKELGALLVRFGEDFFADVCVMRSIRMLITVPGAHHANAFFLRPGSVWIDLQCSAISTADGFSGKVYSAMLPDLIRTLGAHHEYLEAANCEPRERRLFSLKPEIWLPVQLHPLSVLRMIQGFDVFASGNWLCAWRVGSGLHIVDDVLEAVEGRECAVLRCMSWEADCQSIQESRMQGTWFLFRNPSGSLRKWACASMRDGHAAIANEGVRHELYNRDLLAPDDIVQQIDSLQWPA